MKATRRQVLAATAGLALGVCGCGSDLGSITYFLSPEPMEPPAIKKLTCDPKDKKDHVVKRVVLLPYVSLDIAQTEFLGADEQLAEAVSKAIEKQCEENQEKVTIVSGRKVKEYLTRHPNWRIDLEPVVIGKDFHADYVVVIDVHSLGMYEQGSSHQIYRGQADLTVTLVEVSQPDETPEQREMHFVYPTEARADVVDLDTPPNVFKAKFFAHIGKKLAWQFAPHRKREGYYVE